MNDGAVLDFADYPMTPVSVMPLHPAEFLDYREWYACGLGNPTKLTPRSVWNGTKDAYTEAEIDKLTEDCW